MDLSSARLLHKPGVAKTTKRVFDDFGALPLIVIDLRTDPRPRAGLPTPLGGFMRKPVISDRLRLVQYLASPPPILGHSRAHASAVVIWGCRCHRTARAKLDQPGQARASLVKPERLVGKYRFTSRALLDDFAKRIFEGFIRRPWGV